MRWHAVRTPEELRQAIAQAERFTQEVRDGNCTYADIEAMLAQTKMPKLYPGYPYPEDCWLP
jgi:hypothetical protein